MPRMNTATHTDARRAEPRAQPGAATANTRGERLRGLAILAVSLAVFVLLALRIPLASEVRYIEAAREMVERGDWVVPHLAYVPYFEKPILLYWTAAASRLVFGDSSIAVRLPALLAAACSVWITYDVARRLLGARIATRTALLLLGSGYYLVMGSTLTTDALFSFCLWAAWYAYWRSLEIGDRWWKWGYCLAVALAFLTKGPLALIFVGGSIATFHVLDAPLHADDPSGWRVWPRRVRRGLRAALIHATPFRALAVLIVLSVPWTLLVLERDPRLLTFFYVRENFLAFFEGNIHHTQNYGFYAAVILAAFLPWPLAGLFGLASAVRTRVVAAVRGTSASNPASEPDRLRMYLFGIVLFTLLFLEASSAKLATYPLPIVPALVLLSVDVWAARSGRIPGWLRWSLFAGFLLLPVGAGCVKAAPESLA